MNQTNKQIAQTAQILTYAGLIPFMFLGLGASLHVTMFDCALALRTYGIAIIAFLCGIQWAIYLTQNEKCRYNLLIFSNLITLVGFSTTIYANGVAACLVQSLCFAALLKFDHELAQGELIPIWYYHLRRNATCAVITLLTVTAFFA